MMGFFVRTENTEDRLPVGEVLVRAFNRFDEYNLVTALRQNPAFLPQLALVAEIKKESGSQVVGYGLCTEVQVQEEERLCPCLSLAPLAVHPEYQNKGCGQEILQEMLARCQNLSYPFIVVLGKPNIYRKMGFRQADSFGISPPFDVDPAFYHLYPFQEIPPGIIQYPPAFQGI